MIVLDFGEAVDTPLREFHDKFTFTPKIDKDAFLPHKLVGDVSVSLTYFVDYDGALNLKGNLRVECEFTCDRCSSVFDKNLFLDIDEKIASQDTSEDDEESYDLPKIDIEKVLTDFIISAFPQRVLCKENCKGLCPTCGVNLNDETCECDAQKVGKNNPFKELFSSKLGGKSNGSTKK